MSITLSISAAPNRESQQLARVLVLVRAGDGPEDSLGIEQESLGGTNMEGLD